jgi:hypothetical protein
MMNHRCVLVVSLLALCAPRAASAQSTQDPRALFEQGVAHIDQGRFADAIIALEASQRLRESPAVTYNLGLAYRGVGRAHDAIRMLERYVAQPSRDATAAELTAVRQTIATIRATLVMLNVTVAPSSATLIIDGVVEARRGEFTIDAGRHNVEARAAGYEAQQQQVTYLPGAREALTVALVRSPSVGVLRVEPNANNAVVFIDGARVGVGAVERTVAEGDHRVRVEAVGYTAFERVAHVGRDERARVSVALERPGVGGWAIGLGVAAGVAVVGGTIAAIAIATSGPWAYSGSPDATWLGRN